MNEKEYFTRDLLNPRHPQHKFFRELRAEVLKDPRVFCWSGNTSRIPVEFAVTGQSRLAISEISPTDVVDENADFNTLLTAVRNRDYIFVVDAKKHYRGMLTYREVIKSIRDEEAVRKKAGALCKKRRVIMETDLSRILAQKDALLSDALDEQGGIFAVLSPDGELLAKLAVLR
jgi:hypothetical protein